MNAELETKGKVISRWTARYVDTIENLIFLGRVERLWQALIQKADLRPGEKVLDVGCGTGRVVSLASNLVGSEGRVVGIDASPKMIELARERIAKEGTTAEFRTAVMEELPFAAGSFDAVLSSQALHHVPREAKIRALRKMLRVLRPGGRLLILDHGKPYAWYLKILFFPFRWNVAEYQAENFRGEVPGMIEEVFGTVEETARLFGWMRIWQSRKPAKI